MKITLLTFTAFVQSATFQAPGKIPATGNRRHFMTLMTVPHENYMFASGGMAYGADYGMSGDLVSGYMFNAFLESSEAFGNEVDIKNKILWGQVQNDDTWFYYQSPLNDEWYKAIYVPFEERAAFSRWIGSKSMTTVNGTEVYGLIHCNDAIRQLYASVVNGGTDTDALRATCEEKCLAYTEATDFTNAKNCSDPAGSLPIGAEGSPHPWLKPLYEFVGEVEEKVENGESTNYILDFVAPHTVGSKIFPELADGDRNITQIANAFKDGTNAWQAWREELAQADVEENDLWDMCRRLRSHGADVNCWDEEQWSEYEWSEDDWSEYEWSEDEDMDEYMEKEKNCRIINYAILSDANPKDYPSVPTEFRDPSNFYQYGTNCIAGGMLVADCDCSDAENYNFQNQGIILQFALIVLQFAVISLQFAAIIFQFYVIILQFAVISLQFAVISL